MAEKEGPGRYDTAIGNIIVGIASIIGGLLFVGGGLLWATGMNTVEGPDSGAWQAAIIGLHFLVLGQICHAVGRLR